MKIVIIGAGKIGNSIIKHVANEGHEVVAIDTNSKVIEDIVNQADVMGLVGNGALMNIQQQAGVDKADIVIAATRSDEANILCCLIAKKLGATNTIARVREYEYNKQINMLQDTLGIKLTINPELESAREIMRVMNFPNAIKVDSFAKGNVDLVELFIPETSQLVGTSLADINKKNPFKILVCAVQRDDKVFIPNGSFIFKEKDKIHIIFKRNESRLIMDKLGIEKAKIRDILIIGGSTSTVYLAEDLIKNNYNVKIIENSYDRCCELSVLLPKATIIHGDGSNQTVLKEEGLMKSDAIICLTGNDEENIIISMYANKNKVPKIITKINKVSFGGLMESVEMATIIYPMEITASQIVSYIRASANRRGNSIKTLYKLVNNQVEAIEFEILNEKSKLLNVCLKDLKLKKNIIIAGIIRNGEMIVPNGYSLIKLGDSVIVTTLVDNVLNDIEDILA